MWVLSVSWKCWNSFFVWRVWEVLGSIGGPGEYWGLVSRARLTENFLRYKVEMGLRAVLGSWEAFWICLLFWLFICWCNFQEVQGERGDSSWCWWCWCYWANQTGHVDHAEFADQAELADHTDVADHTSLTGQVDHADQAELSFHRRIKMRESLLQQKSKLDSRLDLL